MLAKYKALQADIKTQEEQAEEEAQNINELLAEKSAKQQEVQALTASTNENIQSYIYQISASQDEISALNTQISNADSSIYSLLQAAEAEKAAQEAQVAQEAEAAAQSPSDGETMAQRNPTMTTASLKVIPIRTQMTAVPMMILIPSHPTAVKAPTVLPRAAVHLHRNLPWNLYSHRILQLCTVLRNSRKPDSQRNCSYSGKNRCHGWCAIRNSAPDQWKCVYSGGSWNTLRTCGYLF